MNSFLKLYFRNTIIYFHLRYQWYPTPKSIPNNQIQAKRPSDFIFDQCTLSDTAISIFLLNLASNAHYVSVLEKICINSHFRSTNRSCNWHTRKETREPVSYSINRPRIRIYSILPITFPISPEKFVEVNSTLYTLIVPFVSDLCEDSELSGREYLSE